MELSSGLEGQTARWMNGQENATTAFLPNKRKRDDVGPGSNGVHNGHADISNSVFPEHHRNNRSFVHISGQKGVFVSERWEPNGSTLYLPVVGSLLTNVNKYDQISFEQGLFFIGDISGAYQQKAEGQAVHCWRYSEQERKLFIALSFFFTNMEAFQDVVASLGCL